MDNRKNNTRIAKNTAYLYFRMFFLLVIGLYTSRVVLNALGITDFGIYNVVGSIVAIFGFINGSMGTATSRFLSYELGSKESSGAKLSRVFHTALTIHIGIAVLIFLIGETAGMWYVVNELRMPPERTTAAIWVLECSLITTFFQIVSVPYNAVIISRERMSAFAYISIYEAIMQLAIAFVVKYAPSDRLIIYAILIMILQASVRIIYGIYCSKYFPEVRGKLVFDKKLFKEMAHFAGWIMNGALAIVCYMQGLNIILNFFFGPAVNAARGLAVTIQGKISQFCQNFQTAVIPQITKSYATRDFSYMHTLIINSSVFSLYLMLFLSLPLLLETEFILKIWLKTVPEHTVSFVRLTLLTGIVESLRMPMNSAVHATGKIKRFQLFEGTLLLLILPTGWLCLYLGCSPISVFISQLIIFIIVQYVRVLIVCPMIKLSKRKYFSQIVLKFLIVCIVGCFTPVLINILMHGEYNEWAHFFIVSLISLLSVGITIWFVGLNSNLRHSLYIKFISKFHKK